MGLESRADARVRYEFRFPDDRLWVHEVDLAGAGGRVENGPEWARLDFQQCSHCPLNAAQVRDCPFALALARPTREAQRLVPILAALAEHACLTGHPARAASYAREALDGYMLYALEADRLNYLLWKAGALARTSVRPRAPALTAAGAGVSRSPTREHPN